METRGRKRKFNTAIPAHISQNQLPDSCYWDNSASGHWYTTYKDETGRQRRKRIASKHATLSDLHKIIEELKGVDKNTYKWLSNLFQKSTQFKDLATSTQSDYRYCSKIVEAHPTKLNKPLGEVSLSKWNAPLIQKLVDQMSVTRGASAANHALRYTRRLLKWGKNRGYIPENYATGVEQAKETPSQKLVSEDAYMRVLNYAIECGNLLPKTKGSAPPYIWMIMEIAYLCRLRGIEVITLTEDKATDQGIICDRTKGSRTNIAEWNGRLKKVWKSAIDKRNAIWSASKHPIPHIAKNRFVIINHDGMAIRKQSLDNAWQRFIKRAIKLEIITEEERFSLHDLKRKGATDTKGTRAEKQEATGHRSAAMMDVYDKSVPLVKPSGE